MEITEVFIEINGVTNIIIGAFHFLNTWMLSVCIFGSKKRL
jgi:hypothetical protein